MIFNRGANFPFLLVLYQYFNRITKSSSCEYFGLCLFYGCIKYFKGFPSNVSTSLHTVSPIHFSFFFSFIVSQGAQEIFKLLPHTFVDACKLPELVEEVFIVILLLFLPLFLIFFLH